MEDDGKTLLVCVLIVLACVCEMLNLKFPWN